MYLVAPRRVHPRPGWSILDESGLQRYELRHYGGKMFILRKAASWLRADVTRTDSEVMGAEAHLRIYGL